MRALFSLLLLVSTSLAVHAEGLVKIESQHSVKETANRLASAIEQRGIKIAARVDHAAGAKAAGLELAPSELLVFGNPKLGTPLMQTNPEAGVDLPMKIITWQDGAGKVWIGFTDPADIKSRHGIKGHDEIFATMRKALDGLARAAGGK